MAKKNKRYKIAQIGEDNRPQLNSNLTVGGRFMDAANLFNPGPTPQVPVNPEGTGTAPADYQKIVDWSQLQLPVGWQLFNLAAQGLTGVANRVTDAKSSRIENARYIQALQQPFSENFNANGYGDVPAYYKAGGSTISKAEAFAILKQGTVKGHPLSRQQKIFFRKIAKTGKIPPPNSIHQTGGYDVTPVLAEAGEVYQDNDGNINKISDSADTHDDRSGGVVLTDAQRILEDTSTSRRDKASKALKLSPEQAKALLGIKAKGDLSHAKAMEKASAELKKNVNRFEEKLKKNVADLKSRSNDKYASNSMKFNLQNISQLPTEGDMFDTLFNHQETIKNVMGISNDGHKAQMGWGIPLFPQDGAVDTQTRLNAFRHRAAANRKRYELEQSNKGKNPTSTYGITAYKGDRTYKGNASKYSDKDWQEFAKSVGYTGNDPKEFQIHLFNDPRFQDIIVGLHKQFGDVQGAEAGMFDGRLGHRWDVIKDAIEQGDLPTTQVDPTSPDDYFSTTTTSKDGTPIIPISGTKDKSSFNLKQQPKSHFFEPLHWYDVAGPIQNILEGRQLNNYNPVELNKIRLHQQNPLPIIQQGQRDYNAALQTLPNNGQGYANIANLYSRKYALNNEVLGKYEDINKSILDKQDIYNAGVSDRQSAADQGAREAFEQKVLGSKEALRQTHMTGWNDLYTRLALNRKLNREGNLLMQLFPAFDQNADYNGYQAVIREPLSFPPTGLNPFAFPVNTQQTTKKKTITS